MLFLQYFEYYRLQGVTKFYVPNRFGLSNATRRLLTYYSSLGLVELDPWTAHFPGCTEKDPRYCSDMPQKSACILRSAFEHRFALLCDFDELMRPVDPSLRLVDFLNKQVEEDPQIGRDCGFYC